MRTVFACQGETPTCSKTTPAYSVNGLEHAVEKVMDIARSTFVRGDFPMDRSNYEEPLLEHPNNSDEEADRTIMPFLVQ